MLKEQAVDDIEKNEEKEEDDVNPEGFPKQEEDEAPHSPNEDEERDEESDPPLFEARVEIVDPKEAEGHAENHVGFEGFGLIKLVFPRDGVDGRGDVFGRVIGIDGVFFPAVRADVVVESGYFFVTGFAVRHKAKGIIDHSRGLEN